MPDGSIAPIDPALLRDIAMSALEEDGWQNDVTTQALVPGDQLGRAIITAKEPGVVAGLYAAETVFQTVSASLAFRAVVADGTAIASGELFAEVDGSIAALLTAERVALNLLQRLSGIATATREMVEAVAGLDVVILDTRKTTPGLRELERYAVLAGGGTNHRFNLSDGVLIKDNHIAAARVRELSIAQMIEKARGESPEAMVVEIEVTSVDEAREALEGRADVVLLDNMGLEEMRAVVKLAKNVALTEASGGVTVANVRKVAETGVDRISVGALTHSPRALDISMKIEPHG